MELRENKSMIDATSYPTRETVFDKIPNWKRMLNENCHSCHPFNSTETVKILQMSIGNLVFNASSIPVGNQYSMSCNCTLMGLQSLTLSMLIACHIFSPWGHAL